MPTVRELTALYENFLLTPRAGEGVCVTCFNFTDGYERCYACTHGQAWLDAVAPISYSPAHEQLHHVLAGYKRLSGEVARRLATELAALLWRYLAEHEGCVARAAGVGAFPLVTTVPSGTPERDQSHPLRRIVGELVAATRGRHVRLLRRSAAKIETRAFSTDRYEAIESLNGESVLLVDDTWTTGANAQSAAATLKAAGAGRVAAVVIGRHVNREWHDTDRRLRTLPQPFRWDHCALCAPETAPEAIREGTVAA
jgi:predicted amidophosphoribosyltransferase